MDYVYVYLLPLRQIRTDEWEAVDADIIAADSTTEIELTADLLLFEYQLPPLMRLKRYLYRVTESGLECFIENEKHLYFISRGGRADSEVLSLIQNGQI